MSFPLIPILAAIGIIGGVSALVWYSNQTNETRNKANKLAMDWFGRRFQQLAESQQEAIRKQIG